MQTRCVMAQGLTGENAMQKMKSFIVHERSLKAADDGIKLLVTSTSGRLEWWPFWHLAGYWMLFKVKIGWLTPRHPFSRQPTGAQHCLLNSLPNCIYGGTSSTTPATTLYSWPPFVLCPKLPVAMSIVGLCTRGSMADPGTVGTHLTHLHQTTSSCMLAAIPPDIPSSAYMRCSTLSQTFREPITLFSMLPPSSQISRTSKARHIRCKKKKYICTRMS